jgi:hypothetical protein
MIANLKPYDLPFLIRAAEDCILGVKPDKLPQRPAGRIIAWGALGKRGSMLLPHLKGTSLEPDEIWDNAGDCEKIKKPDPGSLNADDLVLVLPVKAAADAIYDTLKKSGCAVLFSSDIEKSLSFLKYPQFYNDSLLFSPEGI